MAGSDLQTKLVFVEYGTEAEGEAGDRRAFLRVGEEVATYCPDCAREEFGDG